jgi:tetratricopeptide (TPR) repeat protein
MARSARLHELERKFKENPRRFFAPLANELRKLGQADAAIAICRQFVPGQPGHISGHIVMAQALFEAGQYREAGAAFESALALDPENLIALRHLGDIAKMKGDLPRARGLYQRVREVDPRNDEAAALIAAIDAARARSATPEGGTRAVDAADGAAGWGMINPEASPEATEASAAPVTPAASAAPVTPAAGSVPLLPAAVPGPRRTPSQPLIAFEDPVLEGFEDVDDAAPPPPTDPGGAFVTETMAELYLEQGHRDAAVTVYRELLSQRPDHAPFRERLEHLESEDEGGKTTEEIAREEVQTARGFFAAFAARRPSTLSAESAAGVDAAAFARATYEPAPYDEQAFGSLGFDASAYGAESLIAGGASGAMAPGLDLERSVDVALSARPPATGSISALFPGEHVAGVDETAAARLASAFGGPSPSQPASDRSLDAIFGADELATETAQFTNWLSALKKP